MQLSRSNTMLAQPVKLQQAFDDPGLIHSLIEQGAPYKTITTVQKNPANDNTPGWFRNFWALGGKVIFDGAEEVFYNPNFIEAAKKSFKAEVIQPLAMMTNLNVPAPASPPHLDLPYFRGAHKREVPAWMLAPMGYSGLFQQWAIPVASAISWFYGDVGGDFEYWPNGMGATSSRVSPPYSNMSVIADNEYMYHRVGQMGNEEDYLSDGIPSDSLLYREDGGWNIKHREKLIRHYSDQQIRVSVLWKAYCFENQYAADSFKDPSHNLSPEKIVEIFNNDLAGKGIAVAEPSDLAADQKWMGIIRKHYGAPDGEAY